MGSTSDGYRLRGYLLAFLALAVLTGGGWWWMVSAPDPDRRSAGSAAATPTPAYSPAAPEYRQGYPATAPSAGLVFDVDPATGRITRFRSVEPVPSTGVGGPGRPAAGDVEKELPLSPNSVRREVTTLTRDKAMDWDLTLAPGNYSLQSICVASGDLHFQVDGGRSQPRSIGARCNGELSVISVAVDGRVRIKVTYAGPGSAWVGVVLERPF